MHLIPQDVVASYQIGEWHNATGVLQTAQPEAWGDICAMLRAFRFSTRDILAGGGRKSVIAQRIDDFLFARGWRETGFEPVIRIGTEEHKSPTHKVDCFKNRVGLEIEWNNKDPFFDRDLNNFRLLFDLRVIDVGVIVTRASFLQEIFKGLGMKIANKYGASTTHFDKLVPRLEGGGGGGCPILAFGITQACYTEEQEFDDR